MTDLEHDGTDLSTTNTRATNDAEAHLRSAPIARSERHVQWQSMASVPARAIVAPARKLATWLAAGEERATYRSSPATAADAPDVEMLRKGFEETTKEAKNLFVLHVSVIGYSLLTLGGVRDEDFYGSRGTVQLPLLNVQVPAVVFFLAAPLLAAAEAAYLQIYLGYIRRFYRLLARRTAAGIDDEARALESREALQAQLHPWIATLADSRGRFGALVRILFTILTNYGAPVVAIAYWLRLMPLDARLNDLWERHLPPMVLAGSLAFATSTLFMMWAATRRTLDARVGVGREISTGGWLLRILGVTLVGAACLPATNTRELLCERWPGRQRARFLCEVNLEQAVLSRPSKDGIPALGVLLQGAQLRGANLRGAYLENANLEKADLAAADLDGAYLRGARLNGASLQGAQFVGTELAGANFSLVRLPDGKFEATHLEGANFEAARLQDVNFKAAELQKAHFLKAELHGADFKEAHLEGSNFTLAHFHGARMRGLRLPGAIFTEAELQGAHFEGADIVGANFALAMLQGADFEAARLQGADFVTAHLQGADFQSAELQGADLSSSYLQGANFETAHLQGTTFSRAKVHGADFVSSFVEAGPLVSEDDNPSTWPATVRQSLANRNEPAHMDDAIGCASSSKEACFCSTLGFTLDGGGQLGGSGCRQLRCAAIAEVGMADPAERASLKEAYDAAEMGVAGEALNPCTPMRDP
jgi:uncharacterized protein YjbI with pentapeptide repeats